MSEFPRRQIGRTDLSVTELGLGCATLGGSQIAVARAVAEEIVGAAWAAGVRYVDTAPFYGVGQAERCVGDALRDHPRDEWVLSNKVGRLLRRNPTGIFADGRDTRCRSMWCTTTPTTGSCARSRTAFSVLAWRGSTSSMCTISAPTSTASRRMWR